MLLQLPARHKLSGMETETRKCAHPGCTATFIPRTSRRYCKAHSSSAARLQRYRAGLPKGALAARQAEYRRRRIKRAENELTRYKAYVYKLAHYFIPEDRSDFPWAGTRKGGRPGKSTAVPQSRRGYKTASEVVADVLKTFYEIQSGKRPWKGSRRQIKKPGSWFYRAVEIRAGSFLQ